ncbi:MAG: hypothetical protein ACNA8W_07120 [Bradymonadaceae bacterium]
MSLLLAGACATSPQVGVRAPYQGASVGTIAIVPFYAINSFSIPDKEFREVLRSYEESTMRFLSRSGFEVIDTRVLKHHLTELGVWEEFREGVALRESLTSYFEPASPDRGISIEVATLKRFQEKGWLPADSLFFGELVYHSQGTCRLDARRYTTYAKTNVTREAPGDFPRPCVVSHFQAKLVDAASGQTMWYNRMLLETHSDRVDMQLVQANVSAAVQETLGSGRGIEAFIPPEQQGAETVVETQP